MKESGNEDCCDSIRLDRLLVYLRFARTRSAACAMIEGRAFRRNRQHVKRVSENVQIGDVLTFMQGDTVRIIEVLSLPDQRASPAAAKQHYRDLGIG
ncbi:RNA-binding S4 domain-containing protein [Erythrobacter insulae]|uniref:RNA-binding S4 domain-containing protein n=1 Tax=Erythrobacter insulae TaxID=2584124 RepID=A0A547PB53_9SPHN|nr:S4 domain-containing protein [Erythrobacter insulae]TRD11378.1 RNA-binding S4 domain-containing protein [Erythrobacter insulae]